MGAKCGECHGVHAVCVGASALDYLPGTEFADAYQVAVADGLTAPQLVDLLFAGSPRWVRRLMALRDRVMAQFGVRPAGQGPFPVVSRDPQRMVLGYDDTHLDFRLVAELAPGEAGYPTFTLTTLVRVNNLLGRLYLPVILPFHRRIARAMLAKLARPAP